MSSLQKNEGLQGLSPGVAEELIVGGDLAKLTPAQRVEYYVRLCEACGLNALMRPFEYLFLGGKLVLYARKQAAEELRRLNNVSIVITDAGIQENLYVVRARASTPAGRTDEAIGAVSIAGLSGDQLANAVMKAETKAKRRVTLSICGLGILDESEVPSIEGASRAVVDETGELLTDLPKERKSAMPPSGADDAEKAARKERWAEIQRRTKLTSTYLRELAEKTKSLGLGPEDMLAVCEEVAEIGLVKGDAYDTIEARLHARAGADEPI